MEAGKKRLNGDTQREANTDEVQELKQENRDLKELVAELSLEVRLQKKTYVETNKTKNITVSRDWN